MSASTKDAELSARIPPGIRFGTSSWTYPGWQNLIYFDSYANARDFNQRSLGEYCHHPLLRSVGIDSSFYRPLSPSQWTGYASLAPPEFKWVWKLWERLTIPKFPALPRYGTLAGLTNPDFLNSELFSREVLPSLSLPEVAPHMGPMVLQFPTIPSGVLSATDFFGRLSVFLGQLPSNVSAAVEVRNPEYLCAEYFSVLNFHGATHCFNHWHRMPALSVQMKAAAQAGGLKANFLVARILTPLGVSYEQAVKLFSPYSAIKRPNPEMRRDVQRLVRRALERSSEAYIIVNNRAEGCAPLTIRAIAEAIVNGTK